jgi:hypothetical protein
VNICEDTQTDYVDVEFTVQADTPELITLPTAITPKPVDGSVGIVACVAQRESERSTCELQAMWKGCVLAATQNDAEPPPESTDKSALYIQRAELQAGLQLPLHTAWHLQCVTMKVGGLHAATLR